MSFSFTMMLSGIFAFSLLSCGPGKYSQTLSTKSSSTSTSTVPSASSNETSSVPTYTTPTANSTGNFDRILALTSPQKGQTVKLDSSHVLILKGLCHAGGATLIFSGDIAGNTSCGGDGQFLYTYTLSSKVVLMGYVFVEGVQKVTSGSTTWDDYLDAVIKFSAP